MTQRLLVVGGNGLLGRHIRPAAERRGWLTTVVALHPDIRVRACPSERDLAAFVAEGRWDAVVDLRAFNSASARVVVETMKADATLILVSSIYAYCHPRTHPERDLRALTEESLQTPSGPYGPGKLEAEAEALGSQLETVYAVRLPYVFGAGDRSERTQRFVNSSPEGLSFDDGSREVGLVSAAVVAERLVLLAGRRIPARQLLNMDGGRSWTLREHRQAAVKCRSGAKSESYPDEVPFNPGRDYSLDSSAATQLLDLDVDDDLDRQWRNVLAHG